MEHYFILFLRYNNKSNWQVINISKSSSMVRGQWGFHLHKNRFQLKTFLEVLVWPVKGWPNMEPVSGKDLAEIFKSITLHKVKRDEGLNFLRKGGVTYVTG